MELCWKCFGRRWRTVSWNTRFVADGSREAGRLSDAANRWAGGRDQRGDVGCAGCRGGGRGRSGDGLPVEVAYDVGVAGLHRLVEPLRRLRGARVDAIVVAAGMDGALPSVMAGLVDVPVIGLPTSVGYGAGGGASRRCCRCCRPARQGCWWSTSTTASAPAPARR